MFDICRINENKNENGDQENKNIKLDIFIGVVDQTLKNAPLPTLRATTNSPDILRS